MKILDIGHRNLRLDEAISVLETEISHAIYRGKYRAMKIIHGHGSGVLKREVRNWCRQQDGRFQGVVFGENYDIFDPVTADMRADCGHPRDTDLGKKNGAVTYIWF